MNNNLLLSIANDLGKLLKEKYEAYGNSFEESCEVLKILYPEGVEPENYQNLLTITRILDKLFRIATSPKAFNEDPFLDIAGYGILAVASEKSIYQDSTKEAMKYEDPTKNPI